MNRLFTIASALIFAGALLNLFYEKDGSSTSYSESETILLSEQGTLSGHGELKDLMFLSRLEEVPMEAASARVMCSITVNCPGGGAVGCTGEGDFEATCSAVNVAGVVAAECWGDAGSEENSC